MLCVYINWYKLSAPIVNPFQLQKHQRHLAKQPKLYYTRLRVGVLSLTLTCGLTKYSKGFALSRSLTSIWRRTASRRAEPKADTSSRLMASVARGSSWKSGMDFFRCSVTLMGTDCKMWDRSIPGISSAWQVDGRGGGFSTSTGLNDPAFAGSPGQQSRREHEVLLILLRIPVHAR